MKVYGITIVHMYMRISTNHNSLGCEQLQGLDVKQSPNAQDAFRPMPGLFSCAGVTGSTGVLHHVRIAQMAGHIESSMRQSRHATL